MSRLPQLTGSEVVRILCRGGFVIDRKSRHYVLLNERTRRRVTVPMHGSKTLKKGTLAAIIKQAGFTVEEFAGL